MDVDIIEKFLCYVDLPSPLHNKLFEKTAFIDWMVANNNDMLIFLEMKFCGRGIPLEHFTYFKQYYHIDMVLHYYYNTLMNNPVSRRKLNIDDETDEPPKTLWCLNDEKLDRGKVYNKLKKYIKQGIKRKLSTRFESNYMVMTSKDLTIIDPNSLKYQYCMINMYRIANMSPVFTLLGSVHLFGYDYIACFMNGIGESIENLHYFDVNLNDFMVELFFALSLLERDGLKLSINYDVNPYMLTYKLNEKKRLYFTDDKYYIINSKVMPVLSTAFSVVQEESTAREMLSEFGFCPDKMDMKKCELHKDELKKYIDAECYHVYSDVSKDPVYPVSLRILPDVLETIEKMKSINIEKTLPYALLNPDDIDLKDIDNSIDDYELYFEYNNKVINLPFIKITLLYNWNHGIKKEVEEFFYSRS
ncbi:MAG: hypothetical protein KDH96_09555 [Candidatus Riesia sp.]|nr:hypothetical protein [Candidatus Riesia sp.]